MNTYKEYQADFQATHQMAEELRANCPPVKELKDDIKKMETDKLQLNNKISIFKQRFANKPDFMALFEVTSKLRKEQEEDSNLDKKLIKQQNEIEDLEERIMVAKQRYIDAKRNLSDNVSAFELLDSLRNQRNSNRDTYEHLSKFEIPDKRQKLKLIEDIIGQPEISRDDINKINNDKRAIQNDIEKLEAKLKNSASKSSELSIYKQNATQSSNLKEQALKVLEKTEKEKVFLFFCYIYINTQSLLEHKYSDLEKKYENSKGYKFVKKDDLIQQAENVKKKKEIYNKYNKILDAYKGEILILDRTINILKSKASNYDEILKKLEEKQGVSGNFETR